MTSRAFVLARLLVLATGLKMKTPCLLLTVMWPVAAFGQDPASVAPLSAPAQRSAEDLENLAAPMALYPDPLIAVMLPAAVYPVEIVNAARFVRDPNNLAAIDAQPWDDNVKAVARFPSVIQYMSDQLNWTVELGQAFTEQPLELMEAIQALRARAQSAGTLQTTPEQVVIVTNAVVERTFETQIVYVTNTIVQVMPSNPQVVYVPVYNPTVVFAPPPTYVYNPAVPLITFGAGIAVGAILANNSVNWYYGGVYYGRGGFPYWSFGRYRYYPPPPHFRPPPYRPPPGYRPPRPGYRPPGFPPPGTLPPGRPTPLPSPWRPDRNRLPGGGSPRPRPSITTADRGWATRPAPTPGGSGTRPGPAPGSGARPGPAPGSGGGNRPSTGTGGNRPAVPSTPSPTQPATRPSPSPGNTPPGPGGSRPGPGGSARPSPGRPPSSGSGLGEMSNGSQSRDFSNRGASSRGNPGGSRGNTSSPSGNRGGGRQ